MNKLIVFDLDGTLAEHKASLDAGMATLLSGLPRVTKARHQELKSIRKRL